MAMAIPTTTLKQPDRTDSPARLTRKEQELLAFLKRHAGKCLPRDVILREVWGYREGVRSRTLDVHVQRLRKKLGPEQAARILTVFRKGYLWAPDPEFMEGILEAEPERPIGERG